MTLPPDLGNHDDCNPEVQPTERLDVHIRAVLESAIDAHRNELLIYESLRNLNEIIGTEYGDRVLYELIQNAHDAHRADEQGQIAVKLVVRSESDGILYVANKGNGFSWENVKAILNLATTTKEIGESIGNKGLGFRSIEALTDDVRIFSRRDRNKATRFNGYCFRFACVNEKETLLRENGIDDATARNVAMTIPRYLVPLPLDEQPDEVQWYARQGYATVIVAPLRTEKAIELAKRQVLALADLDVPILLFLDRIKKFHVDMETPDGSVRRRLSRRQTTINNVSGVAGCCLHEIRVGDDRRFLVVKRKIDKTRVLEAVEQSIPYAPQLERWLEWKGEPTLSIAVGLSPRAVTTGRLYNFLPMGDETIAPLHGHLDAPFFTEIDRRNADFKLPLNATLMEVAAETCAHAALHIIKQEDFQISQRSIFDLVAWIDKHADLLDDALDEIHPPHGSAPVVPVITNAGNCWANLSEVSIWPIGTFSLMKAENVAKRTDAQLVSAELDDSRLARLNAMARRRGRLLHPDGLLLAEWSEKFALSLAHGNAAARTWTRFYKDLDHIFDVANAELSNLAGKKIFLDRSQKLRAASGSDATPGRRIFVRSEAQRRKKTDDIALLPPATLTRRYHFVDEKSISQDTLNAFIKADLVHIYDPLEALAGLGAVLSTNANDNRRREALKWAFNVWRVVGDRIQDALPGAQLHVPTWRGWQLAERAIFSSSWTPTGQILENFLVEASDVSPDCRKTQNSLLLNIANWPDDSVATKKNKWIDFLTLLGVVDGLRPVEGRLHEANEGRLWDWLVRRGDDEEALDRNWCQAVSHVSFGYPQTIYYRKGEVWRFPGQIEHAKLSDTAKEAFQELTFRHLERHNTEYLTFRVGRFDRPERNWDQKILPTPITTFLQSQAWIAVDTPEGIEFHNTHQCWAARTKQDRPPSFVPRVADTILVCIQQNQEFADLVFDDAIGLQDWQCKDTATERLQALANNIPSLMPREYRRFYSEYRRAWFDVTDTRAELPDDLDLAVRRDGRLEKLHGDTVASPTVVITQRAHTLEATYIESSGHALLDIGEGAPDDVVAELLAETGRFKPRRYDGVGVRLLVDGELFEPSTNDPLLTSIGLEWMPEVVLLSHEILGKELERATVDRRIRAIRVRRCYSIILVVDEESVLPTDSMKWYSYNHPETPTLILSNQVQLTWTTLGVDLSGEISQLSQLKFLESFLPRLAMHQHQVDDRLGAPSDEVLARVLQRNVQTLQEHRAVFRTDLGHVLHLLIPVVAYYGGIDLARQLEIDAEHARATFNISHWLQSRLPVTKPSPNDIMNACTRATDRAFLRKELNLDYARFNRVLQDLGEKMLSNEEKLRSVYAAYLQKMGPHIQERLRRHHIVDFQNGHNLKSYVKRKTFDFLEFDPEWIQTKETLDSETVKIYVKEYLDKILGKDHYIDLPPLHKVIKTNRQSVRDFAIHATPIVGAWCYCKKISLPEPWKDEDPQSLVRHLENNGFLDFEEISDIQIPELCARAECWPNDMPRTIDINFLELNSVDVERNAKDREEKRQKQIIEKRSIDFGGIILDTGDQLFFEKFRTEAENSIARDNSWFERSGQFKLTKSISSKGDDSKKGSGVGRGQGRKKSISESKRRTMGIFSEWLAFQYLQRHHEDIFNETCWVSKNRSHFCSGNEGDDTVGYDFCVKTPKTEWLYEVKSSLEDTREFELTPNEMSVAARVSRYSRKQYRILYVPFVFSPDSWSVQVLPNPMSNEARDYFTQVGSGAIRFKFEL